MEPDRALSKRTQIVPVPIHISYLLRTPLNWKVRILSVANYLINYTVPTIRTHGNAQAYFSRTVYITGRDLWIPRKVASVWLTCIQRSSFILYVG